MNPRAVATAFRIVAIAEAASWLGLLAGMYVKWVLETSEVGVQVFGPIHGAIFVAYVRRRPGRRAGCCAGRRGRRLLALAASVPPLVTVWFERWATRTGRLPQRAPSPCRLRLDGAAIARMAEPVLPDDRPSPARPHRAGAARGPRARAGRRCGPRRRAGLVGRRRRRGRAAHRRPVPARVDQQDGHRRRRDAAARRGPAAPRRPAGAAPARHAARRPHGRAAALAPGRRLGGEPRRLVGAHARRLAGRARRRRRRTSSSARPGASTTRTSASDCSASSSPALRGISWEDAVRDEVLAPLGMTRTTPRPVAAPPRRAAPCTRGRTSSCPSPSTTPA